MEFLWFGWSGYPVIVFPTEMGRFYDHENAGLVDALARKIDDGFLQILCVDSNDAQGWYNDSIAPSERGASHEAYVGYLRDEIVPYVRERSQRESLGVFGCGFGAYHAANLAVRLPDVVSRAVCIGGAFDLRRFTDGHWTEIERRNAPLDAIDALDVRETARLRNVAWAIVASDEPTADDGIALAKTLRTTGITPTVELWPKPRLQNRHNWNEAAARLI